jgi:Ca2+-binding RTX toxin-like protein
MNLSAIAVAVLDGVAQIFASGSDEGVTQFALDLSDLSDSQIGSDQGDVISGDGGQNLLAGMAGDDTLSAGGGDDRLIDGSGQDTLFGGAGADVFIFVADGEHDMIADFENGTDLIHLGEIPMLYGFDQLTLTPQGDGVQLAFGNETLLIMPDSGTLQVSDLTADDFIFGF